MSKWLDWSNEIYLYLLVWINSDHLDSKCCDFVLSAFSSHFTQVYLINWIIFHITTKNSYFSSSQSLVQILFGITGILHSVLNKTLLWLPRVHSIFDFTKITAKINRSNQTAKVARTSFNKAWSASHVHDICDGGQGSALKKWRTKKKKYKWVTSTKCKTKQAAHQGLQWSQAGRQR